MDKRLELHEKLVEVLGSRNVYFQPPASIKMKYPAIVYERNDILNRHANNQVYNRRVAYTITLIDSNPDSETVVKLSQLPLCGYDRHFESDNLNHDVFTLYY